MDAVFIDTRLERFKLQPSTMVYSFSDALRSTYGDNCIVSKLPIGKPQPTLRLPVYREICFQDTTEPPELLQTEPRAYEEFFRLVGALFIYINSVPSHIVIVDIPIYFSKDAKDLIETRRELY